MDVNGGTSYSNMGTSQLLSVPYSLYSASSVWKKSGTSINYLDGMVGIGTNIPVAVLDITRNNAATNSQLWLSQKGSGDATMGFLVPTSNWSIGIDQNDGGKFKIASSYDASYLTKMTFSKDGNVGIGTTDPISSARLHVTSSSGYAGYFSSDSSSSMTQAVRGQYNGSGATDGVGVYGYSHPVDNYGIGGYFRGGYRGVVGYSTGVGTVYYYGVRGIAETTGAGHTYGVYGSATTNGGTAYGLYCSGSGAYTGTWTDVSDAKFKSNVADYTESALGKIMLLRPVTFTMKTSEYPFMGFETGTQIGFIAQEVKIVFPSLVENEVHPGENHDDPGIEYEGMNYIGLIPVLVKAIQEQQEEIELLKAEIELLKSK
ncbi:hypothetical protein SDC9_90426 [bioreactor metagenome]|uniref:Peptidase S74 domain-containing protein n=1 Tax=bioreactor metagenome TaxID=1076179 RepID=A0A644ZRX9_9ZZZZ